MQQLLDSLSKSGSLPPPRGAEPGAQPQLAPQALQWALFYMAQHHDRLGDTGVALPLMCTLSSCGACRHAPCKVCMVSGRPSGCFEHESSPGAALQQWKPFMSLANASSACQAIEKEPGAVLCAGCQAVT